MHVHASFHPGNHFQKLSPHEELQLLPSAQLCDTTFKPFGLKPAACSFKDCINDRWPEQAQA